MKGLFRAAVIASIICVGGGAKDLLPEEDSLIMQGLVQDEASNFRSAQEVFMRLYQLTGRPEYLVQAAKEAMMPGGDPGKLIPVLRKWVDTHAKAGEDLAPVRLLVALYAKQGDLQSAEPLADRWLARSGNPVDLKLAATVKSDLGKNEEAVKLLEKAYRKSDEEKYLLDEVALLEKRLKDRKRAIRLLESRLRMNPDSSVAIYFKLIELYAKENDLKKVQKLYEKLYEKNPENYILQKIIKLALYTRDFASLTRFLEKHPSGNEELLYMLYKEQNRYDKAIRLAHRRYEETGKPRWLAEEAILSYEKARAEHKVTPKLLKRFRALFEKALKEGADEGLYLNYYGYTLIDHDLDVARGLELVRRALKQQPDNAYYLDSLAWGLYKEGQCAEAARVMQKVIAGEGLREPEIKMHWESIQKCLEKR